MSDFTYSVVVSSLHDPTHTDAFISAVLSPLDDLGGRLAEMSDLEARTPHVIVVATGGTEAATLDIVRRRRIHAPGEPVVLIAHGLHNSLPAALEALARVRQQGIAGRIVQIDDAGEPRASIDDLMALDWFRHARLGLIGEPSEWLVASVPGHDVVRRRWGLELVDVPVGDAVRRHGDAADVDVRPVAVRYSGGAEPARETVAAAALHPTLAGMVDEHRLDAVAVRCFDFITDLETSGCIALAELNDTGIVAGCEGDIASTIAMMLARRLLDQPSWIANPARIDVDAGELVLAHCTVAPSMVEDLELHTHFESGLGIGLRGTFAAGPVTLLRFGGRELERHWFAEGEVVASGSADDLCRTQVTLRGLDGLDALVDDPLGNHLVMVRGHHRRRFERWMRLAHGGSGARSG